MCAELMAGYHHPWWLAARTGHPATENGFVTTFWNHYGRPDELYQALTGKLSWTDPVFVDAIT